MVGKKDKFPIYFNDSVVGYLNVIRDNLGRIISLPLSFNVHTNGVLSFMQKDELNRFKGPNLGNLVVSPKWWNYAVNIDSTKDYFFHISWVKGYGNIIQRVSRYDF